MSFIKPLKVFWVVGSAYFTVISAIMFLISLSGSDQLLRADRFLLILMLSFIMGLGTALYWACGFNKTLAFCLHAGTYIAGFAIFLWLSGMKFEGVAIGTLILAAIYTVCTVVVRRLYNTFRKAKKDSTLKPQPETKQKKTEKKDESVKIEAKKSKKAQKEEYQNLFS